MQRQSPFFILSTFIVLVTLAAALRFYGLGTWSYGFDELNTICETQLFFDGKPVPSHMYHGDENNPDLSQAARLPKIIFAAYFIHWVDYRLFGDNEFGCRVLMAVMGTMCVGIVFLLGYPLFGFSGSLILSVLILLFPDHILQSQNSRFYCQAFLFISIVLLLGAHVVVRHSAAAAWCLGPAAVLMVLSHALTGLIWGFLLFGVLFELLVTKRNAKRYCSKTALPWKLVSILGLWSVLLLGIAVFHIMPLAASWNRFYTATVSPVHAVVCLALSLGWSFFLLCLPATLFALFDRRQNGQGYWAVCAIGCASAIFLLPFKIPYIQHYTFLFTFPFLVVLALFFDRIYQKIICSEIPFHRCLAYSWIAFPLFATIPALVSYYENGERPDFRSAYQHVREHWQPGDRLVCYSRLAANRYVPDLEPKIAQRKQKGAEFFQDTLDNHVGGNGRLWIVLEFNRYDPKMDIRRWLYQHAECEARFGNRRYDFKEYSTLEVFLCPIKNKESGRQ